MCGIQITVEVHVYDIHITVEVCVCVLHLTVEVCCIDLIIKYVFVVSTTEMCVWCAYSHRGMCLWCPSNCRGVCSCAVSCGVSMVVASEECHDCHGYGGMHIENC